MPLFIYAESMENFDLHPGKKIRHPVARYKDRPGMELTDFIHREKAPLILLQVGRIKGIEKPGHMVLSSTNGRLQRSEY